MSLCSEPGCGRSRAPRGRYCRSHAKRLNRYGIASGKPIPRAWLLHFAEQAGRVLAANTGHAGLVQATAELQQLLDDAKEALADGRPVDPATRHLARLAAHGVTPLHILIMVAAVILFDQDNPRFLTGTVPYRFAVARAVAGLVPRRQMSLRSQTLSALGDLLVDRYGVLAGAVAKAIDERKAAEASRKAAMSAPFNSIPPT